MLLETLAAGATFRTNYTQRTGTVLHQGMSGTRVKWDGTGEERTIVKKAAWKDQKDTVKTFKTPDRIEVICGATEVTRLTGSFHTQVPAQAGFGSV